MRVNRRVASSIAITAVLVASGVIATPAAAAETVTAEGVALSADASCSNANLDLTFTSSDVDREAGKSSIVDGSEFSVFEQDSGLDDFDSETYFGYGIGLAPQPTGTVVGSYAYLGDTPPTAAGTAEFFVLYRCYDLEPNSVLFTCFGDFGSCPSTAREANTPRLSGPAEAAPGTQVEITGVGCYDTIPFDGPAGTYVVSSGETVVASGTFGNADGYLLSLSFTMPDGPVDVVATCGTVDAPSSFDAEISVLAATATPAPGPVVPTPGPTPAPTPGSAVPVVASPTFTG